MSYCLHPDCKRPENLDTAKFCSSCGSKLFLAERYQAMRLLAKGGFGRTLLATDHHKPARPRCVIKQFHPESGNNSAKALQLFDDEAKRLEALGNHSQIPELYAHFEQDQRQYIIQEFIDGQTLADELEANGAFSERQIRSLLQDLLPVLEFIHNGKVIHRDIKPENIIRRQSDHKLVLVDFGAAKHATATALAKTGTTIGSAGYSAPEQTRGQASYVSDLYSLGVACISLLTDQHPFDLWNSLEGDWIWEQFLRNNPINGGLKQVLNQLIQEKPKDRYPTAAAALAALNPAAAQPSILNIFSKSSPAPTAPPPQSSPAVLNLGNGVTLELVNIRASSFKMGSNEFDDEKPIHTVTVPAFQMGKHPVTQAQYQAVMGTNPSNFKGEKRPVEKVSWNDAVAFCQKLSQKTGRTIRLPSEAEWEYVCRAGSDKKWCFGDNEGDLKNYAWYSANSNSQTHPVGEKKPNAWGLYDMHGNVREWCLDQWHQNYKGAPTDGSAWISDNDNNSHSRLIRGGSWIDYPRTCRSAYRFDISPDNRYISLGFRVVCRAPRTL